MHLFLLTVICRAVYIVGLFISFLPNARSWNSVPVMGLLPYMCLSVTSLRWFVACSERERMVSSPMLAIDLLAVNGLTYSP